MTFLTIYRCDYIHTLLKIEYSTMGLIRTRHIIETNPFNSNKNPETFECFKQYFETINSDVIASNPHLFPLDYSAMSLIRTRHIEADLFAASYNPKRISLCVTSRLDIRFGSPLEI